MQKVKAVIQLHAIRDNAARFAALTNTRLCAVVKANAYGHGAEETVNALEGIADFFAVALVEEGLAIRAAACGKEILVFTPPTDKEEGYALAANGFVASVPDLETAKLLSCVCKQYALPLKVHLKVNTGMNRYGMDGQELKIVCQFLHADPFVKVTGIYSHLCECSYTRAQAQRALFADMQAVCKGYFPKAIAHLSATYGALLGEEFAYDAVRVGIGLYGYLPCEASKHTGVSAERVKMLSLQKAMTVWAKTTATRLFRFGGAGYGEAYRERKPNYLSVARFGYADGFLRKKENGTDNFEKNANALCMDVCIREEKGRLGEWLPIMTDAEKTAAWTGTIAYEVLCAATRRAEFVYDSQTF